MQSRAAGNLEPLKPVDSTVTNFSSIVGKAKLLVVDDEPLNVASLIGVLGAAGYSNVVSVSDPAQARERWIEERPDLVLLDMMATPFTGLDLLAWKQTNFAARNIPVLVLTAVGSTETKLRALHLGAAAYLQKPIQADELTLRLHNALTSKIHQDQLALYDSLTGLPNRAYHADHLEWALRRAKRYGTKGAVLHISIDRFSQINEALGPAMGDRILINVAQRLKAAVREVDLIACHEHDDDGNLLSRIAGDEFTALLSHIARADDAAVVARRIIQAFDLPIVHGEQEIFLSCRIGIAVFPDDGTMRDSILKAAAIAKRFSAPDNSAHYCFYAKELNARAASRLSLESELRHALERDELELYYQPKVATQSGALCGMEALVRWIHPTRGIIGPSEFILVAEECRLIAALGEWALRTGCKQVQAWRREGLAVPGIAINVSGLQFRNPDFPKLVLRALRDAELDPGLLTLELTESTIMNDVDSGIGALRELAGLGIHLAVDDFGTGYSSLSYLRRFPLHELKIDREFISHIDSESDNAAIVSAIVGLAHALGLQVVAEGVETAEELAFLRARGCDQCQGFLFAHPLPATDFRQLLLPVAPAHL
jgi:diguanylate cyclase